LESCGNNGKKLQAQANRVFQLGETRVSFMFLSYLLGSLWCLC